jgi:hypothetical protein
VYIADGNNNRIRKVTIATGIISLVVGKDYGNYFSGDGGDATSATVSSPLGIALDPAGISTFNLILSFTYLLTFCDFRQFVHR